MAYLSTTTPKNNVVKLYQDPVPYPQDTTLANVVNAGDLVWMDTSNHFIASIDNETHAAFFAGVALDGPYIQPYSTKFAQPQLPVGKKGIFRMKMTSGDTYSHGDALYIGADAQTVTKVVGTNILGTVALPPGVTSLAYVAGGELQIQISPLWPVLQG